MDKKLYEIVAELRKAEENLEFDPETGEIINGETFDNLNVDFDTKVEGIACLIKEENAMLDCLAEEKKSLDARIKSHEREIDFFKEYLKTSLDAVGRTKFETAKCKLSFRKSEETIVDKSVEDKLDDKWMNIKITKKPALTKIKEALKNGEIIEGCSLKENRSLQVK